MVPRTWYPQEVLTQCLLINNINREIAFLSYNDICCHCLWHAQNTVDEICRWNTKATFYRCCGTELLSGFGTSVGWFNPILIAIGETFSEQALSMNGRCTSATAGILRLREKRYAIWSLKQLPCFLWPEIPQTELQIFPFVSFPHENKIDSPGEILEKSSCLGPTPRTSVFISLDMAQVLVFLKSPWVILMCSQCW